VSIVWNGLLVRQGTPPAVVQRLNTELRAILESPAFRKPLEAQGYEVLSSTPAEFETLLRKDLAAMATTVQQADIRLD
jgi:tripartite-type tricarboxylate transporter receptor subunit TctC